MNVNHKLDKILTEVKKAVKPSKEDMTFIKSATKKFVKSLNYSLEKRNLRAKAIVAGSGKKQTQLKGRFEVDVFVLFNYNKYVKEHTKLSDVLQSSLKKYNSIKRIHGSRDYFQINVGKCLFEVIPVLKVTSPEKSKNTTDVSPLHAKWVAQHSKNKLDEIRLTKAFMAAQRIYGAESYIRGFSGHACEILTLHYGSFISLLKAAKSWQKKAKKIIDPANHYKSKNPLLMLNKSKTTGPLVLIDPVQKTRNATAALSEEAFSELVKSARRFLKKPSKSFFIKKTFEASHLIKSCKNSKLLLIEFIPNKGKVDVIGAAVVNRYNLLKGAFVKAEFKIKKSSWNWDDKSKSPMVWFCLSKVFPYEYYIRVGPKLSDPKNISKFKKAHTITFLKNKRLYARQKRKFTTPKALVDYTISLKEFKTRFKDIKTKWY